MRHVGFHPKEGNALNSISASSRRVEGGQKRFSRLAVLYGYCYRVFIPWRALTPAPASSSLQAASAVDHALLDVSVPAKRLDDALPTPPRCFIK
jgi:hypothetical protein